MNVKEEKGGKIEILPKNFRGQVTIFIIIALLVVAIIALIILYYPKLFPSGGKDTKNPIGYIRTCVEKEFEENTLIIKSQGGNYITDERTGYLYKRSDKEDAKYVRYLCYTDEYLTLPCINQEPFLTEHIESEILNSIQETVDNCFVSLEKSYKDKGYDVNLNRGKNYVKILPRTILVDFNSTLALKKGDESETYRNFNIEISSSLHEMLEISKNILIWEMNIGDAMPEAYMYDNPYMRVEKHRKGDDSKIYVVTDLNTMEDFRFAVRSLPYV